MGGKAQSRMILGGKRNLGKKPRAKDFGNGDVCRAIWETPNFDKDEPTVEEVLARPAYGFMSDGVRYRLNQRLNWSPADKTRLRILAEAGVDATHAADALGRNEKTLAYKAREEGIVIPSAWTAFLPKPKYIAHPRQPKILLCYPFMVKANRDEDADLIAVNKLVPKGIPDHMRGDVCQDILLAVYEGKVNLASLQRSPKLVREYVNRWRNHNLENGGYGIMSLDPFGDDERSFEDRIAAQADWDYTQMNDMRSNWEAQSRFYTPATQERDLYEKEVRREQMRLHDQGIFTTIKEARALVDEHGRQSKFRDLVADRVQIANCVIACGFTTDARAANPSYGGDNIRLNLKKLELENNRYQSQYIEFKIPHSAIPPIKIRISDHKIPSSHDERLLDTYEIGVSGVINVLKELAANTEEYEAIHRKTGDFWDVMQEIAA